MAVHVFVGPSCPEPPPDVLCADVVWHEPVRHGDLFAAAIRPEDVAVIVDGVYHHGLALRHKEILGALERGVTVVGAASIGALRAAELAEFGMIGVGAIFGWYRDGVFDGDDAVSVAQSVGESPVALSVALVNVYAALCAGRAAGVLDAASAARLLADAQREYYPSRTDERLLAIVESRGETRFADWYRARLATDPYAFDQKRADALAAVRFAMRPPLVPTRTPPSGRDWRTEYFSRWRNRFASDGSAPDPYLRLAYRKIFDPDFPEIWWQYLSSSFSELPGGLRGHVAARLGPVAAAWLDDPTSSARVTSVLVSVPDLTDRATAALLLGGHPPTERLVMLRWLAETAEHLLRRPERSLRQITDDTCARLLTRIWGTADITAERGRRGFASVDDAGDALRPFVIGYLSDLAPAAVAGGDRG